MTDPIDIGELLTAEATKYGLPDAWAEHTRGIVDDIIIALAIDPSHVAELAAHSFQHVAEEALDNPNRGATMLVTYAVAFACAAVALNPVALNPDATGPAPPPGGRGYTGGPVAPSPPPRNGPVASRGIYIGGPL